MTSEHMLNTSRAQGAAAYAWKQSFGIFSALFPNPRFEHCDRGLGQGGATFLASFSAATNMRASAKPYIFVS